MVECCNNNGKKYKFYYKIYCKNHLKNELIEEMKNILEGILYGDHDWNGVDNFENITEYIIENNLSTDFVDLLDELDEIKKSLDIFKNYTEKYKKSIDNSQCEFSSKYKLCRCKNIININDIYKYDNGYNIVYYCKECVNLCGACNNIIPNGKVCVLCYDTKKKYLEGHI